MCKVEGVSVPQLEELRKILSYTLDPVKAHFGGFRSQGRRYLISKRGEFATGLLPIAEGHFKRHDIVYTRIDTRIPPETGLGRAPLPLVGPTPYPEQREAALAAVARIRGTLCAPTGLGKSVIAAMIFSMLQVRTLIIVPTLELKRQLSESFKGFFGALDNVTIENIDSTTLKDAKDYDCLIIDEAHHVAARTYQKLNLKTWGNIYYRFFLTATPFRAKDEEQLLFEAIAGQVIYRIEYQTAVDKGYIVPLEAYYIELPKIKVKGDTWAAVYSELVVNNKYRNRRIAELIDSFKESNISALCLVKEIAHGVNVGKESVHIHAFANGVSEHTREYILEFNLKYRHTLIGTTGVLGEGVDTKPAEYVIIAGLGKSKNSIMQQIGRGFRTYPGKESCKIIIFLDKSHRWAESHFKAQVKILKEEYGVKPVKLDF